MNKILSNLVAGHFYNSSQSYCLKEIKLWLKPAMGLIVLVVLFSMPFSAHALKIIPHFIEVDTPTHKTLPGPKYLIPGSTGSDCSQMTSIELVTTKTGAFCAAALEWQKYIKDKIEIHILVNSTKGPAPFLGAALPMFTTFSGNNAFNLMVNLQKSNNAQDVNSFDVISHLPMLNQFEGVITPPFTMPAPLGACPFSTQDECAYFPETVVIHRSSLKALKVIPNQGNKNEIPACTLLGGPSNCLSLQFDGQIQMADVPNDAIDWDLDPSDGIGISGVNNENISLQQWDQLDYRDSSTVPTCFFSDGTPAPADGSLCTQVGGIDFRGTAMHEIGHVLGIIPPGPNLLQAFRLSPLIPNDAVVYTDLFRFSISELDELVRVNDFRKGIRDLNVFSRRGLPQNDTNVENSNHTFVYEIGREQIHHIPLTEGMIGPFGNSPGHIRSNFNRKRDPDTNAVYGVEIIESYPEGFRLMAPILLRNHISHIAHDDLIILDVQGWDIDYSGNANTGATLAEQTNAVSIEDLADEYGVSSENFLFEIVD